MPIVECPADTPPFTVLRETLAPIFRGRAEFQSAATEWSEHLFVTRLQRVLAQLLPGEVAGFRSRVERDSDGVCVTLTWEGAAEASFTGTGSTEALAFLDAAAKAYAHPYFRKLLDGEPPDERPAPMERISPT